MFHLHLAGLLTFELLTLIAAVFEDLHRQAFAWKMVSPFQ